MIWSIVLAAGSGERFGGVAKQFEVLGGKRVLSWALEVAVEQTDGVVLVVPADARPPDDEHLGAHRAVVAGGDTRAASVRSGLAAVPEEAEMIVVHDAARPLAPASLWESVIGAVRAGAAGALPGLPVTDTIKRVAGGRVEETLDRAELVAAQTPQAFRAEVLRRAHASGASATDDAALVEALGEVVEVVEGDPRAMKITVRHDLHRLEEMLP